MYIQGLRTYASDPWNFLDQLSLIYPVYFCMNIVNPKNSLFLDRHAKTQYLVTEKDKVTVIMNVVIIFYIWIKGTNFFKMFESLGLLMALLFGVMVAVIPFIFIFFVFVAYFCVNSVILGSN
jgi:hypothetical protein